MKPWENDRIITFEDERQATSKPWDNDKIISTEQAPTSEYIKGFSGGVGRGLTEMAGAPVDITNTLLQKAGLGSDTPFMGSKWLQKNIAKLPGFGEESFSNGPNTPVGRTVGRIGEEIGATLIPAGTMLGAAKKSERVLREVTKNRGIVDRLLSQIRQTPGRASVGELAATAGAGTGAGIAKEVAPDNPAAETIGQLAGGFTPGLLSYTPTGFAFNKAKHLFSRFSPKAQAEASRRAVETVMGTTLTPDAKNALAKAHALSQKAPGFQPSVAEATKIRSLSAAQKELETSATGEFLDKITARRLNNEKAIQSFINNNAPKGDIDTEIIFDTASKRIQTVGAKIERQVGQNLQTQKDLASGIPTIDKLTTGNSIRDGINQARREASVRMSIRAEELGINSKDVSDSFKEWGKGIIAKYKPTSRFTNPKDAPDIFKLIKKDVSKKVPKGKKEVVTTFQDIKTIRERVSDELIEAMEKNERGKVRFLTRLRQDVDELVDSLDEQLGENYSQFRKEYYEEYITPYESGAVFKVKNRDGTGFYRARGEQVADMFFDNQSASKQYYGIFKDNPEMMKHLESSVLDRMRNEVAPDGIINEKRLASFMRKNSDSLKELPTIKSKITNIESTQKALLQRQGQLAARRADLENKALAKQLSKYAKGDTTGDKILNSAVQNPQQMKSLYSFIKKDKDAVNSLKRTLWEKTTQGSSSDILKFLDTNRKSLEVVFGKQHFRNIEDVSAMRSMIETVPASYGKSDMPTPMEAIEKLVGMGVPQASTRWYAFMSGRLAKSYLMADITRAFLYNKGRINIQNIMKDALYDPQIAKEMASSFRGMTMTEPTAKRIGARMFALGLPYLQQEDIQNGK